LHNYKIAASLGRHASNMIASSVVVDTGAGASVIRPETLPDGWDEVRHSRGRGATWVECRGGRVVWSGSCGVCCTEWMGVWTRVGL